MEFFNDYALLFAVSLPVVAIVGLQSYLFVAGESGTLLLPSLKPYPSINGMPKRSSNSFKTWPGKGAAPLTHKRVGSFNPAGACTILR